MSEKHGHTVWYIDILLGKKKPTNLWLYGKLPVVVLTRSLPYNLQYYTQGNVTCQHFYTEGYTEKKNPN